VPGTCVRDPLDDLLRVVLEDDAGLLASDSGDGSSSPCRKQVPCHTRPLPWSLLLDFRRARLSLPTGLSPVVWDGPFSIDGSRADWNGLGSSTVRLGASHDQHRAACLTQDSLGNAAQGHAKDAAAPMGTSHN